MIEVITQPGGTVNEVYLAEVRALLDRAVPGGFADQDWENALGGHQVILLEDGWVVAHAAVVWRTLWIGDREVDAGYVEAVASQPERPGRGLAPVMREARRLIEHHHEIGAVGTSDHALYENHRWVRWQGPTFVRRPGGDERTEGDDDRVMVLLHDGSPEVDLTSSIICEERPGRPW